MSKHLTSPSNPLVKQAVQLKHKARERKAQGMFIAEGLREIRLALANGFEATHLFYNPELTSSELIEELVKDAVIFPKEIITVNKPVLNKIAYRSSVPNVVGLFKNKPLSGGEPQIKNENPLVLVLEGIGKPGNFGAILRTADAAGVDAVFVCGPDFDLFNPNAIRASLGAIFTLPVFEMPSQAVVGFLKKQNIEIYATSLQTAQSLFECNLKKATALVVGGGGHRHHLFLGRAGR